LECATHDAEQLIAEHSRWAIEQIQSKASGFSADEN
jgi:hypothetical protein